MHCGDEGNLMTCVAGVEGTPCPQSATLLLEFVVLSSAKVLHVFEDSGGLYESGGMGATRRCGVRSVPKR